MKLLYTFRILGALMFTVTRIYAMYGKFLEVVKVLMCLCGSGIKEENAGD